MTPSLRLIAFYLPQYHPIPENDRWWGKGFTEWHNVVKAKPLFPGHYQPRLPSELGYYDLRVPEVRDEQAKLARDHGIYGFCYYYYWFNGKQLLERPILDIFRSGTPDFPFCLCWANENWTRRWDGGSSEILIEQVHSMESDRDFIHSVAPFFRDARYIKVNDKPLFLVYRSDILPNPRRTIEIWREEALKLGIGEIYLVRVESFYSCDPTEIGFDAACEFPPHLIGKKFRLSYIDSAMTVLDYEQTAVDSINRATPPYKQFKGIMPSWDNTARRGDNAHIFVNESPRKYQEWLAQLVEFTNKNFAGDEKMIFVNAWNEWAEGCHLEPDLEHGRAYLEATKAALIQCGVCTDHRHGEELRNFPVNDSEAKLLAYSYGTPSKQELQYKEWLFKHALQESDHLQLNDYMENRWTVRPKIHLIINLEPHQQAMLADTVESLGSQIYQNWRLTVIAPYPSPDPMFDELEILSWVMREEDVSVEHAVNQAVVETGGDWVVVIHPGDRFEPHLLAVCVGYINSFPSWRFLYTDEDCVNGVGERFDPLFKPDFNLDLLRSTAYVGNFCLVQRDVLVELGGFVRFEAANYDVGLRILDFHGENAIGHIPSVLHHHYVDSSDQLDRREVDQACMRSLIEHLERRRIDARVSLGLIPNTFFIDYPLTNTPLVSIIIPTRDRLDLIKPCVSSLLDKTSYPAFEILIVDNNSREQEVLAFFDELSSSFESIKILRYPLPYNFSAINNFAARHASGEYLLLLNNDTVILQGNWLERMMAHGLRSEVGVVGPRLVFPDKTLQHAGVILGMGEFGVAEHIHIGLSINELGYMGRAQVVQNFSAVTGACLLIRKDLYNQVGGMDEKRFEVLFNDIDLCLKVGELGYKIVWTPHATILHHGSSSLNQQHDPARAKCNQQAIAHMLEAWLPKLANDPAFNRNLSLVKRNPSIEVETDVTWDVNLETRRRVLAFPCNSSGTGEYRVRAPLRALENAGRAVHSLLANHDGQAVRVPTLTELVRANPDVLLLQNAFDPGFIEAVMRYKSGCNRIMRILGLDDLVFEAPRTNVFRQLGQQNIRKHVRRMLSLCDRVIVATHPIEESLREMIGDIRVVPNYLEKARWVNLTSHRQRGDKPRVGWAGGSQHEADLQIIRPVLRETAGEVDWVFLGMCPESMRPYIKEYHPGVAFDDYPQKLASLNLDIAVAPLEHNRFNMAKSNLRLLEYGILGLPVVCTDILPYHDAPVKRVPNSPNVWINALRERVHDLDRVYKEGDQLKQWVLDHWMLEDHLDEWSRALQAG